MDKVKTKSIDDGKYYKDSRHENNSTNYYMDETVEENPFLTEINTRMDEYSEDSETNDDPTIRLEQVFGDIVSHHEKLRSMLHEYILPDVKIQDMNIEINNDLIYIYTSEIYPPLFDKLNKLKHEWYISESCDTEIKMKICLKL